MNKKKLIGSVAVITLAVAAFIGGTGAYFSDTETSEGNVLAAGAIDLLIDNESYYNGLPYAGTTWLTPANLDDGNGPSADGKYLFFDFQDLKPGDWGEDTISIHVDDNDSYVCMDIEVTATPENGVNEPEGKVDTTDGENEGELQDYLKFVFWGDDGDNVLEDDEEVKIFADNVALSQVGTVAIADSTGNLWDDLNGPLPGGSVRYVGKAWCFGDLSYAPVVQGDNDPTVNSGVICNGENAGNISQTDGVVANVIFNAIQSRHNGRYVCEGCENEGQGYAEFVESYNQGTLKNGDPITDVTRTDPNAALGAAGGNFYSLGFPDSEEVDDGEIVLRLDGPVTGNDILVLEITNGRDTYPEERAEVYVSDNVAGPWTNIGTASNQDNGTGVSNFNVAGLNVRYVKLVDATNPDIHSETADGYDLDAITAKVCLDDVNSTNGEILD